MESDRIKRIIGNFKLQVIPDGKLPLENDIWSMLVNLTELHDFLNEYSQLKAFISDPEILNINEGIVLNLDSSVFQFLNIEILIIADELRINPAYIQIRNISLICGLADLKNVFNEMDQGKIPTENFRILARIVIPKDRTEKEQLVNSYLI